MRAGGTQALDQDGLDVLLAEARDSPERALTGVNFASRRLEGPLRFRGVTFGEGTDFTGAVFPAHVSFQGAVFRAPVSFDGARFEGSALFTSAVFLADGAFNGSHFTGTVDFSATRWQGESWFAGVHFDEGCEFRAAEFAARLWFTGVRVTRGSARFPDAQFAREVWLTALRIDDELRLDGAALAQAVEIREVTCGAASFSGAHFGTRVVFHNVTAARSVALDHAQVGTLRVTSPIRAARVDLTSTTVDQSALLLARADRVALTDVDLVRGGLLGLDADEIDLRGAALGGSTILTGRPAASGGGVWSDESGMRRQSAGVPRRVLSLHGADLSGGLEITHVDLSRCRFGGAHRLDQLRTGAGVTFARTPPGRRWTRRRAIADESIWRSTRYRGWPETSAPDRPGAGAPTPDEVALLYRALRKGLEDCKDEPGAADFYYGEMEMRRHSPETPLGERLLLTLYWATSGYALRATRALCALALLVLVTTPLFLLAGFQDPADPFAPPAATPAPPAAVPAAVDTPALAETARADPFSWLDAWTYTIGTATTLSGPPEAALTPVGRALRLLVRFLGPVLLGLALLSLRGRVRR